MLSAQRESQMKVLEYNVISKKIHSDELLKLKSFLLSFALHGGILLIAWNISPYKSKPILLDAQEKTITVSLANIAPLPASVKKELQKSHPLQKKAVQIPIQKQVKQVQTTAKTVETQTPQKIESQDTKAVQSSEAFTPQSPSNTEKSTKAALVETSTFDNMNSPSLNKAHPKKAQQYDIGKEQLARIRTMIENALCYPAIAKKLRLEGVVLVSFSLRPDGYVQNIQIVSSSGSSVLDKKAVQTVASLDGEYPHLEKKVDLSLPISFSLNKS